MLIILGWDLRNWAHIPKNGIENSKPYNPVLGEVFNVKYELENKTTSTYLCEQVSHHPPITAYYLENKDMQLYFSGYVEPQTSFSINSVNSVLEGKMRMDIEKFQEQYHFKLPIVSCGGIIFGSQTIEIYDSLKIFNFKSNLKVKINFIYSLYYLCTKSRLITKLLRMV